MWSNVTFLLSETLSLVAVWLPGVIGTLNNNTSGTCTFKFWLQNLTIFTIINDDNLAEGIVNNSYDRNNDNNNNDNNSSNNGPKRTNDITVH